MLFSRLVELYESCGVGIRSSVSPFFLEKISNHPDFDGLATYLIENGENIASSGGGIGMSEVGLLEDLGQLISPRRIFGIGCSFGWSTIALAMAFPKAKVVVIDVGWGEGFRGVDFTNDLARAHGLNVVAKIAKSPDGVAPTIAEEFDGPVDFVFIDAEHTDKAQYADFTAVRPHCAPGAVYLFHDVLLCGMTQSFLQMWRDLGETAYRPRL
ncbi:MAG: class I SAM-dependent methyltransferase, partial [Tagaea sp.]|nr:class I SAM-dependent methyltransferase [Tagaea sp.]